MKWVTASAPTRVDFAGGTLDLGPIYLFHQPAYTVNIAITLYARVTIETRNDQRIRLTAKDRDAGAEWK